MRIEDSSIFQNEKPKKARYPSQRQDETGKDALTRDELIRSNKELERFAFFAAHDLQEPLRTTYSFVQLLANRYKGRLDGTADKIIASILANSERMQEMIQGLLHYSSVGNGSIQLKEVDCNVLLRRAIENLKTSIEESLAQIKYEACPVIRGDEIQLTQVFQNLINNAIKFRKKEEPPTIQICAQEKDDQWFFSIKDNGIGVDPEYMQRIFDLFGKLHARSEYAGSGIGLALCKRIIESHQGKIWVESEKGKGTTVCFVIPKSASAKEEAGRQAGKTLGGIYQGEESSVVQVGEVRNDAQREYLMARSS